MERMIESRDIKHMACVDRIKQLEEENKKLRAYADNLDSENDNQAIEIEELKKENKNLKEELGKYKKYYDRDKEELMESCYSLARENDKLKSDLSECECSMHFENDEVGYRKRECKNLKEELKELEETLEHRDSVLSIMYDLLRSDLSDYEQLCMIDVVIDVEVGNEPQNKLREELLDRFWKRDF